MQSCQHRDGHTEALVTSGLADEVRLLEKQSEENVMSVLINGFGSPEERTSDSVTVGCEEIGPKRCLASWSGPRSQAMFWKREHLQARAGAFVNIINTTCLGNCKELVAPGEKAVLGRVVGNRNGGVERGQP